MQYILAIIVVAIIVKHSLKYHTPRIANAFYKLSCELYIPQMILKINLQHAFRHFYHLAFISEI